MRPSQKQIAAITQHAMQPEQTTWPKTSAILWGLGTPNWELGILGWGMATPKLLEPKILCHICVRRRTAEKCQRNKLQKLWQPSINSWRNAAKYDKTP